MKTFDLRVKNLRNLVQDKGADGVLISNVYNIRYLSGYSNFSKEEREAYILITKASQYILTDARYKEAVQKEVPWFNLLETKGGLPFYELIGEVVRNEKLGKIGIEENDITISEYKRIKKVAKKTIDINVSQQRTIKEKPEIEDIEKACRIGDEAFNFIIKNIRPGVCEKEVAFLMEGFIRSKGAENSFPAIIAFGRHASVPHHQTGEGKLADKKGQFILLDFGVKVGGYCSDMTRTIFYGEPDEAQRRIYETVKKAQEEAINFVNNSRGKGVKLSGVDKAARDYITSKGYESIPHSVGHGIGFEVHEYPYLSFNSKEILKGGMVFSIEPGVYIPKVGGVRIEDLFVFEKDRLRQLTKSLKSLIVI